MRNNVDKIRGILRAYYDKDKPAEYLLDLYACISKENK